MSSTEEDEAEDAAGDDEQEVDNVDEDGAHEGAEEEAEQDNHGRMSGQMETGAEEDARSYMERKLVAFNKIQGLHQGQGEAVPRYRYPHHRDGRAHHG